MVENSNGNNEGNFKNTKHDATYKMACKDPSTYLHHYDMNSRMHCAKMIEQLKDLQQRVDEANKRKMMDHIKSKTWEIDDDEVLDRLNVKWMKQPNSLQDLLEKLERVMQYKCLEEINEQYQELQDYAASQGG